jgi:hypothetical protein
MCANDPVGAWGAAEYMKKELGIDLTVITGPTTDNSVGRDFVTKRLGLPAVNARTEGDKLAGVVADALR